MANIIRNLSFSQIFDPSCKFIVYWNRFQFVVGLINFFLDPMFLYLPSLQSSHMVIQMDLNLGETLAILRMLGDFLQMLGIIVKFRTACEASGSRVFRKRRLIEEPKEIAVKYLRSTFFVDLIAALPMPQVYIWHQIRASKSSSATFRLSNSGYYNLFDILLVQFPPRFFVLIKSKTEITRRAGIIMKSAMSGAFYNLFLFVNLSNFLGAMYYQFHINWLFDCMDLVRRKGLEPRTLEWDQLLSNCTQNNEMELGMCSSGLTNKIGVRKFIQKYMFCFSWGLKSLSSLGQNFTTSFSTWETTVSIIVTLQGLIFLADLITRMQAGIQSMEEREEQQRVRQREVKEWMEYHQLPLNLKERVNLSIQSEWTGSGINDEIVLDSLPMDLRSEIRKYLYMDSVGKLPKFANMDSSLVEAICQHLKTFSGKESTYIVYEGDIVMQMLFIFSGQLELFFSDRGSSSLTILGPGECCGQELVTWASQPTTSMDNLPPSTWTIKCLTDVEAFALHAYDMKILANQFVHNQEFQRAFKQHYP